jgi:nicotinate-nucleotide adenylyltransferase
MRIGLYGGSFNPPHSAHLAISRAALRALNLDRVWWLVSPGNPLKEKQDLAPLDERLRLAGDLIDDRRIVPTAVEAALGTRYTIDTLTALQRHCPGVRFVWIMGADNLAQFDKWRDWRAIAANVPLAVFDRPGWSNPALRGKAARSLEEYRIDATDAPVLASLAPPAWTFIYGPKSGLSSTELRAKTSRK